jgi:hypothetical protein
MLSAFCFLLSALNAQIEIEELKLTPEIKEKMFTQIKQYMTEKYYSDYGIKNKEQLENLHTAGKPIPEYCIVSENQMLNPVSISNVSFISDGKTLSLRFMGNWNVPVMFDEATLLFGLFGFSDEPHLAQVVKNTIDFHNYEHTDSIIGTVSLGASAPSRQGMDYLIIRKENQDIFVEIYDEVTGEYFKNEYNFSELINRLKELNLREKEARMRYLDKIANKSELKMTPEITKMLVDTIYSKFINRDDKYLSRFGIKNRLQLTNLQLGKPIPEYRIINEKLTFTGYWKVLVMSDDEPLFLAGIKLEDDGQYIWAGMGGAGFAKVLHKYEHKDLIIGFIEKLSPGMSYLIIRKENQDVFVQTYDYATHEHFKNEYTLSEIINSLKK